MSDPVSAPNSSDINASNPYINDAYAPIAQESSFRDLDVIGEIPADLHGVYLRNGPNPKYRPADRHH